VQQFWDGLQVPVRVIDMHVTEVRRQLGNLTLDVVSSAVPSDERPRSESVPHIMQARATAVTAAGQWCSQTDPPAHEREGVADGVVSAAAG